MIALIPKLARIESRLMEADGEFVKGQQLADVAGVTMSELQPLMRRLMNARPNLLIEGRRGWGYRAGSLRQRFAVAEATPLPGKAAVSYQSVYNKGLRAGASLHRRLATNLAMIDLLPPAAAALVRSIAAESGETLDAAAARLISYGAEVHHDLVLSGENPLGLRRAA